MYLWHLSPGRNHVTEESGVGNVLVYCVQSILLVARYHSGSKAFEECHVPYSCAQLSPQNENKTGSVPDQILT